ncbi:hypothetical protein ACFQE0_27395 [Methylobacterium komagatae]|uniref:Uncharacterized protein n=1 Tax=Methylobacterium komagatae TaxID=374425 RepID=A0ABW2BRU0_9HYPH
MVKRDLFLFVFWFFTRWVIATTIIYLVLVEGCGPKWGWREGDGNPSKFATIGGGVIAVIRTVNALRQKLSQK